MLEHIAHVDDKLWAEFGPGAVGIGWDMGLVGLAHHLSGGALPDQQGPGAASAEGREFMARSSERWCDARSRPGGPGRRARGRGPGHRRLHGGAGAKTVTTTRATAYLVIPAVSPATICLVASRKSRISGIVVMTSPAKTAE